MSTRSTASRERLLAAIDGVSGAPVPCSFMIFRALHNQCRDEYEFASRQVEMGLDTRMRLSDLPVRLAPEVTIREWIDQPAEGQALLGRRYETPAGPLTSVVKLTEDWPFEGRLPLFGDYIAPRAAEHLITGPADLEPLRHVLAPPVAKDADAFMQTAREQREFARKHGLLLEGGWRPERRLPGEDRGLVGDNGGTGTVIDALMWMCGATQPLLWAYDEPEFLAALIDLIGNWSLTRLKLHLEAGVELVIRRAWYEGTEFWSPGFYRQFILPGLKREIEVAHQAGARYGYILTSGMMPLAEQLLESGMDVIIGIDPGEGKGTTLEQVREAFGGRVGLWGGVSGPLSVEQATEDQVKEAVRDTMERLAPTQRFILSPVDNIRAEDEQCRRNVRVFIDTWKALTA